MNSTSLHVLVTTAGGGQGIEAVSALARAGHRVRALVRDAARHRASLQRAGAREIVAVADLAADGSALDAAFAGIEALVLLLPLAFDPQALVRQAASLVAAARRAGVGRVVYNASICYHDGPTGYRFFDEGIARAAGRVLGCGLPAVVLRPPLYLDNLLAPWTRPLIEKQGVISYPLPAGVALPWTTQHNAAAFVVAALGNPDPLAGRVVLDIADPDPLTGEELAGRLGAVLGRSLRYEAISPAAFGARVREVWGEAAAEHVTSLYAVLGRDGATLLRERDFQAAHLRLRPEVERLETWARRNWR